MFAGIVKPDFTTAFDLQQVTIYDNYIRGENFYRKNFNNLNLQLNQPVELVRDHKNIHDSFAVKACVNELQIGYLAAYENIVIANMLDAGAKLFASISALNKVYNNKDGLGRMGYLQNTIAIKIETELMVPLSNIKLSDLTEHRADDAWETYRKGYDFNQVKIY